jgi:spermidine/putrescine transport system substrate-binding protein
VKKIFDGRAALSAIALAAVTLSGCSKNDGKTLYLFNWSYYTPPATIAEFEKEFGVKVRLEEYESNEVMYGKLKAGAAKYDIVVPSQDFVSIMIKEGMLREIDHAQFPNSKFISSLVLGKASYDPTMKYSVPYYMGAAGIAVNKTKVSAYEKSWNIFSRQDLKDHMCMLDDMREVIGDALKYRGKSVNSLDDADLADARDLLVKEWKPNLVKFDAAGFGKSFAAGDFWVVQGYGEVVYGEVAESDWDDIDFFIPKEGGPMYIDSMCILKTSKNPDLAMKFINFMHRPEIYSQFLDFFHFPSGVNTDAGYFMTVKPIYTAEELENCEIKEDLDVNLEKFNALWEDIRFSN